MYDDQPNGLLGKAYLPTLIELALIVGGILLILFAWLS
ncbi:hypothetical protein ACVIYH_009074 [Bradyrhizobium diazoefficiens]